MDHEEGLCVGCGEVTTDTTECNCTQAVFACAACCDSEAALRCQTCRERERRAVYGCRDYRGRPGTRQGHGRLPARRGAGRRLGVSVPCRLTARPTAGGRPPVCTSATSRHGLRAASSGTGLSAAPQAPPGGVQPHHFAGAAERPCRRAAGNGLGVAVQQRRQGGGVQPPRLAITARQRRQYERSGY